MTETELAIDKAQGFLRSLQRFDLATLLEQCSIAIKDARQGMHIDDDWYPNVQVTYGLVLAPKPIDEAIRALPEHDQKRMAEAIFNGFNRTDAGDDLSVETLPIAITGAAVVLAELIVQRELMISVSTGGHRIQDVNDYYVAREFRINSALPADINYTNPFSDLWDWYRHWSENLPQYKDRRHYIRQMFAPAILTVSSRSTVSVPERQPTGWERVDRGIAKARSQLDLATVEEDFQAIGLLCREIIISLAQAVFDDEIHQTLDGVEASKTDANRMLEAYVAYVFPGPSNKEVRAHHRAALALALNLQHRRTATRQLAALCFEATASTVSVVSIIARNIDVQ